MLSLDASYTATTPLLYVTDATIASFSPLQQGANSYIFTATSANMSIGVAETGITNGLSEFYNDMRNRFT